MTSNANEGAQPVPRLRRRAVRAACLVLSLLAIGVSMGASGIGSMLASVVLLAAGLLLPFVGSAWFGVCLAIMLFHMVYVGPLHGIELVAGEFRRHALTFPIVALAPGLASALVQAWRHR